MGDRYVTCEECFEYRKEYDDKNNKQDIVLAKLDVEMGMVKKIMYSILGVLVSGFAGTIFSILSIR